MRSSVCSLLLQGRPADLAQVLNAFSASMTLYFLHASIVNFVTRLLGMAEAGKGKADCRAGSLIFVMTNSIVMKMLWRRQQALSLSCFM